MLKNLSRYTFALIGLTLLFGSCKKDYESIQSVDAQKIKDYLAANNIKAKEDTLKTGYYYLIIPRTKLDTTKYKNTDYVLYNGVVKSMTNGTVYLTTPTYANLGTYVGYSNSLNGASIPAIRAVMLKMRPGDTARIFLPSYLAFGKNGSGDIPSNENIELVITTYDYKTQEELDESLIVKFIADNGLTGMKKDPSSGVYYDVSTAGTDPKSTTNFSTVTATYTGRLTNGTVFDSNTGVSFSLAPGSVIDGWTKTIPEKIGVGGKMRMLIPSGQGYKTTGSGTISPNSILDFDVEITAVTN